MLNFLLFFGDLEAECGINTAQKGEESQGGACLGMRGRKRREERRVKLVERSGTKPSPAGLWEMGVRKCRFIIRYATHSQLYELCSPQNTMQRQALGHIAST